MCDDLLLRAQEAFQSEDGCACEKYEPCKFHAQIVTFVLKEIEKETKT